MSDHFSKMMNQPKTFNGPQIFYRGNEEDIFQFLQDFGCWQNKNVNFWRCDNCIDINHKKYYFVIVEICQLPVQAEEDVISCAM